MSVRDIKLISLELLLSIIMKLILCSPNKNDLEIVEEYKVYYSLNSTLQVFRQYSDSDFVRHMLNTFIAHCPRKPSEVYCERRHPFIVIEGTHRPVRRIVSKMLARKISGKLLYNPPRYMVRNKEYFNNTLALRRAFFSLGVYGTSYKARQLVSLKPVVVGGYFLDQVTFGIYKKTDHIPCLNSPVFKWPEELLVPDLIFYIQTPTLSPPTNVSIRTEERTQRILKLYQCWKEVRTIEIKTTHKYAEITQLIIKSINKELNKTYVENVIQS
uniref:Uncharacterized protein n=1 Tax=Clastoptera arizonana TaxID=38151 RepID=A0A1B6CH15_9HEMI